MFSIVKNTANYNTRGDVISTTNETVFESEDLAETMKYRHANSKGGYFVSIDNKKCITLRTVHEGAQLSFAEIFRIIEGDEKYQAVMNDMAPAQNEYDYVQNLKK